jgi:hypothetical protein
MAQLLGRPSTSQALQEAMAEYIENHSDELPAKTIINIIKPQQVNINLATRLELKLIKKDLTIVVQRLESGEGNQNFYMERLKELLPKALKVYRKTSDQELEQLLAQTEKWV